MQTEEIIKKQNWWSIVGKEPYSFDTIKSCGLVTNNPQIKHHFTSLNFKQTDRDKIPFKKRFTFELAYNSY